MTEVNTEVVAVEEVAAQKAPAKNETKKACCAKQPIYINGRYVVEKNLACKPQKGNNP